MRTTLHELVMVALVGFAGAYCATYGGLVRSNHASHHGSGLEHLPSPQTSDGLAVLGFGEFSVPTVREDFICGGCGLCTVGAPSEDLAVSGTVTNPAVNSVNSEPGLPSVGQHPVCEAIEVLPRLAHSNAPTSVSGEPRGFRVFAPLLHLLPCAVEGGNFTVDDSPMAHTPSCLPLEFGLGSESAVDGVEFAVAVLRDYEETWLPPLGHSPVGESVEVLPRGAKRLLPLANSVPNLIKGVSFSPQHARVTDLTVLFPVFRSHAGSNIVF